MKTIRRMNLFDFGVMNRIFDGKSVFEYSDEGRKFNTSTWFGIKNLLKFLMMLTTRKVFILRKDNETVGFIHLQNNQVRGFYVKKKYRRLGYGAELLKTAESESNGKISLVISKDNVSTINFFKKHGYRIIKYIDGKVIEMKKQISKKM